MSDYKEVNIVPYSFKKLTADKTVAQYLAEFEKPGFNVNDVDTETNEPLIISAVKLGYDKAVIALMKKAEKDKVDLDVNALDSQKRTALHHACINKHVLLIKEFLKYKTAKSNLIASVTLQDDEGKRPLDYLPPAQTNRDIAQILFYTVCECGRLDAFTQLCSKGVKIDEYKSADEPSTPLHIAVAAGHSEIVSALLEKLEAPDANFTGAEKKPRGITKREDEENSNNSALHLAAYHRWPDLVLLLISKGAMPNWLNGDDQTPLMYAFESRSNNETDNAKLVQIIRIFADLQRDKFYAKGDIQTRIAKNGETYLHIALRLAKPHTMEKKGNAASDEPNQITGFILNAIPDKHPIINAVTKENKTPLQYAVEYHYEMIPFLLVKGASLICDDKKSPTILHYMFQKNFLNGLKLLCQNVLPEKLIELMAIKSEPDHKTALHLAAKGESEYLSLLLTKFDDKYKGIINAIDEDKNTALHLAIEANNTPNVIALLKCNASLDSVNNKGESAIILAIRLNKYEILIELLKTLTKIQFQNLGRTKNRDGSTLLHEAVKIEGHEDYKGDKDNILVFILNKLENPRVISELMNIQDSQGNTPAHSALLNKKYRNYIAIQSKGINLKATNKDSQSVEQLANDFNTRREILRVQGQMEQREKDNQKSEQLKKERAKEDKAREERASAELARLASSRNSSGNDPGSRSSRSPSVVGVSTVPQNTLTEPPTLTSVLPGIPSHISGTATPTDPLSSTPPSARSDMGNSEQPLVDDAGELAKEQPQQAIDKQVGVENRKSKLPSTFANLVNKISSTRACQHIARNKYKYLIGGISILLLAAGFLALCVFCPPVAAKIAILALVTKVFIKTNLATAATAWLKPVAQAITVTLPATIPLVISVVTLGITFGVCKIIDFGKWVSNLCSSGDRQNKTSVEYKPVATEELADNDRKEKQSVLTDGMSSNPLLSEKSLLHAKAVSAPIVQNNGGWQWLKKIDEEFMQPFVKGFSIFCCPITNTDKDSAQINKESKRAQAQENLRAANESPSVTPP